ncbi:MAG: LysR family transcriptional regulator [Comamonas sp.]|jgi:DNA-binding transcriptional LysR family regulator|nr:LysR family transcriptional regulator [Comamonas sp.]
MELRHLRYFIAAAEEEHFGRAAERMYVTRPAVSQIIADLENEMGTPLFERQAHRVKLTAAGSVFLTQLQELMRGLSQAITVTRDVGAGRTGMLNIGYGSLTLLHPLFRAAVKAFNEALPDVKLSLVEIPSSQQVRALADGRIHAGFMHFSNMPDATKKRKGKENGLDQESTVLDSLKIQTEGLGLVVPKDHPFAQRKSVALAELISEKWVVIPHSTVSPGYGPLYTICQQAGFEPRIVQEVNSITTLLNLVSVGVGIGLVVTGKGFVFPNNLSVLHIEDVSYPSTFALCWVRGRMEPTLARFIDVVKEVK